MPVPKSYYTTPELIALTHKRWPDEDDPEGALRRLCHDGDVPAWIIDQKTGERVNVPADRFFGRPQVFRCNLKSGCAMLVRKDPNVLRLNYSPQVYRGELQIGREEFDKLPSAVVVPAETAAGELSSDVGDKGASPKMGRPSRKPEIEPAWCRLLKAGEFDFDEPKARAVKAVRVEILKTSKDRRGLGNGAIMNVISPLFDAENASS